MCIVIKYLQFNGVLLEKYFFSLLMFFGPIISSLIYAFAS